MRNDVGAAAEAGARLGPHDRHARGLDRLGQRRIGFPFDHDGLRERELADHELRRRTQFGLRRQHDRFAGSRGQRALDRRFLDGGYVIGVAAVVFTTRVGLPPEWRLFVITGFLGGLTTFSTYSVEVMTHAVQGEFGWASVVAALHLTGSFTLTALGMWTARAWFAAA